MKSVQEFSIEGQQVSSNQPDLTNEPQMEAPLIDDKSLEPDFGRELLSSRQDKEPLSADERLEHVEPEGEENISDEDASGEITNFI